MTDVVIQAENLGKQYTIGHQAERGGYVALRDVLVNNARNLWRTTTESGVAAGLLPTTLAARGRVRGEVPEELI